MAGKNKPGLAHIVRQFGQQFMQQHKLSPGQIKALHNIVQCRTEALGGHEEVCDTCGETRYSYNSCGDRHCPKCQITKQAIWVEDLVAATLPVRHYHVIFTVPHHLNAICLWNAGLYYSLLFDAVWPTLRSFGYTHYGVETGAIAILHSWGQNLSLHPHIHCLVPAAGYALNGQWKNIGINNKFLYPVGQLSSAFKGKFLESLKRKLKKEGVFNSFSNAFYEASQTPWVVHCEPSMAGAEHVMHYLGQYTHRVAITNHRIVKVTDTHVTFMAKDYRDNAHQKPVTLSGVEFLRRFCQHVMPHGFVRIRRYGIYNPTTIRCHNLQFIPEAQVAAQKLEKSIETRQQRIVRLTGFDACKCQACKKGNMIRIGIFPRIRSPAADLPSLLYAKLV
jgi:hypothetical protein